MTPLVLCMQFQVVKVEAKGEVETVEDKLQVAQEEVQAAQGEGEMIKV